ncbi:aminoglycoside adenylyltransferase domain-containing protein [Luteipulveratus mongoliensis]|uniref:aminoglycoside adenylyltransferase domain-containing protein n=1 Tax=Luteipulveratus mongoliensis TaxID=571913 RepID=UPI0006980AEE|nr:aminoglycoside adenylyltransferase domain-containing protein [Luteipulveratus mongoliensis]
MGVIETVSVPAAVSTVVDDALERVDAALAGTSCDLVGLYLHGSLCWGEFFSGSDIDFVGVLSRPADDAVVAALRGVHGELATIGGRPAYDGIYVTEGDLTRPAADLAEYPGVLDNVFELGHHGDANPVTWAELAERGITMRGTPVAQLGVHTNPEELQAFTRGNLEAYWGRQAVVLGVLTEAIPSWASEWCVLGINRLHHVLQTGRITSKSGAGRWALDELDAKHHQVIREGLSVRESGISDPVYDADPRLRQQAIVAVMRDVLGRYGL